MAGNQEYEAQQAANQLRAAKKRLDACKSAQAGTPLAADTNNAQRQFDAAQRQFDAAYGAYQTNMGSGARPRSSF